ncbi:MAG: hypothetical protein ABIM89_03715 [Mycobacteriales bacterium]
MPGAGRAAAGDRARQARAAAPPENAPGAARKTGPGTFQPPAGTTSAGRPSFDRAASERYGDRPARSSGSGRPSTDRGARASRDVESPTGRGVSATGPRSGPPRGYAGAGSDRPDMLRRERPAEPALPKDATPALLDTDVRRELSSLAPDNATRVGAHLAAAGILLEDDPKTAYKHAMFAKALGGRIGVVREAAGIAAYHAGEFSVSLAELRAARRITGDFSHLPLMADCERALKRPDRALAVAADPDAKRLPKASQVELAIVCSGARRDMGQADAAVVSLQGPDLDADVVAEWSVRLWYAYAEALLAAGRKDDARQWFEAVASIDDEEETDAADRLDSF